MGNKQSQKIVNSITAAYNQELNKESQILKSTTLDFLSEPALIGLLTSLLNKKVKDTEISAYQKSLKLSFTQEETNDEYEQKKRKYNETKVQTMLTAGHELLPEVKLALESLDALEDIPGARYEGLTQFTDKIINQYLCSILIKLSKEQEQQEQKSFYTRVGQYLKSEAIEVLEKGSTGAGVSTAINFAMLFVDPKELIKNKVLAQQVYGLFKGMQSLSLYGWSKQALVIDRSIDYIKKEIAAGLMAEKASKSIDLEKVRRIIGIINYMGLARGSMEDFLVGIELAEGIAGVTETAVLSSIVEKDVLKSILALDDDQANPLLKSRGGFIFEKKSLAYSIPYEQLYIPKEMWIKEKSDIYCAGTDGTYYYAFTANNGILKIGAGKYKMKGKIYQQMAIPDSLKAITNLLYLNNQFYCTLEDKKLLYKINMSSLKIKESRHKSSLLPNAKEFFIAASQQFLTIFEPLLQQEHEEENNSSIRKLAKLYVYDTISKQYALNGKEIEYFIADPEKIFICGNHIILLSKKNMLYDVFDMEQGKLLKKEENCDISGIFNKSVCNDSITGDVYLLCSSPEGLRLSKIFKLGAKQESIPAMETKYQEVKNIFMQEEKKIFEVDEEKKSKISNYLGLEEVQKNKEKLQISDLLPLDNLLTLLAHRAEESEREIMLMESEKAEEIIKIFKYPISIQLTNVSITTQLRLIQFYFNQLIKQKQSSSDLLIPQKLISVLTIFTTHIIALLKCNLNLADVLGLAGSPSYELFMELFHKIALPISQNSIPAIASLPPIYHTSLLFTIEKLIKSSQSLIATDISAMIGSLISTLNNVISGKFIDKDIKRMISYLSSDDNINTIINKIVNEKDAKALELLKVYFKLEGLYAQRAVKEYSESGFSEQVKIQLAVINEMSDKIGHIVEQVMIRSHSAIIAEEKASEMLLIETLPEMTIPTMYPIVEAITASYIVFKQEMLKNKDIGTLKTLFIEEYQKFWKYIEEVCSHNIILFHMINLLATTAFGLQSKTPDHLIRLANEYVHAGEKLKDLFKILAQDKEKLSANSNAAPAGDDPSKVIPSVASLLGSQNMIFEFPEGGVITSSISIEKEFTFKQANYLKILTIVPADIPLPPTNSIQIYEINKKGGDTLGQITRANPKFSKCVKGNQVKIIVKIEYEALKGANAQLYTGCKILLKPKYLYGQLFLKEILRKLQYSGCYLLKLSLEKFSYSDSGLGSSPAEGSPNIGGTAAQEAPQESTVNQGKLSGLSKPQQSFLHSTVVSRALSGGLPEKSYMKVFSSGFNSQYSKIKGLFDTPKEGEPAKALIDEDLAAIQLISDILSPGKANPILDQVFHALQVSHEKKQKLHLMTSKISSGTELIIRATFALLLKTSNLLGEFQILVNASQKEKSILSSIPEYILYLWGTANKMRLWFIEKKRELPEDATEEQCKKIIEQVENAMMRKIELLLNFRTPPESSNAGGNLLNKEQIRKRKLVKHIQDDLNSPSAGSSALSSGGADLNKKQATITEEEEMKSRLNKWKDVQMSVLSEESLKNEFSSGIMQILQSDITAEQLATHLEKYYMHGVLLLGCLNIIQKMFSQLYSTSLRVNLIGWIKALFTREAGGTWHYSYTTIAMGDEFMKSLQNAFFQIIKDLLNYAKVTQKYIELEAFMEGLKWNYKRSDFPIIYDIGLLNFLSANSPSQFLANIWGKPLVPEVDVMPELLWDTFEFSVVKIVSKIMEASRTPILQKLPSIDISAKSLSLTDSHAEGLLLELILSLLFTELTNAAQNYISLSSGMNMELALRYSDAARGDKKKIDEDRTSDKRKITKEFWKESGNFYSADFCSRILLLLHHLCVLEDSCGISILPFSENHLFTLLLLLENGSYQHQFLVIQIMNYLVKTSLDMLEKTCEKFSKAEDEPGNSVSPTSRTIKFCNSPLINLLILYGMRRREGIWFVEKKSKDLSYAHSKCVVLLIRNILSINEKLREMIAPIIRTLIFGKKQDLEKNLPPECRNSRFIDFMLCVAGGEAEALHKGAIGFAKEGQQHAIVAFASSRIDPNRESVCEWDYVPKAHDQIVTHRLGEISCTGDISILKLPIYEFVPSALIPNYDLLLGQKISPEDVLNLLDLLYSENKATSIAVDSLTYLKVRLMKIMMLIIQKDKELRKKIFSEKIILILMETALKSPKMESSRSLLTTELVVEEMRRVASKIDKHTLMQSGSFVPGVKLQGSKLVIHTIKAVSNIRMVAHLGLEALVPGCRYDLEIIQSRNKIAIDLQNKIIENKVVFVKDPNIAEMDSELAKLCGKAKAVVFSVPLVSLFPPDIQASGSSSKTPIIIPSKSCCLIQISQTAMNEIESSLNSIGELTHKMQFTSIDKIMAEYMKKEIKVPLIDPSKRTPREVLKEMMSDKAKKEEKKEEKPKKSRNEVYQKFFAGTDKYEAMYKEGQDNAIVDEKTLYKKEYATWFTRLFEKAEDPALENYNNLLKDLQIYYARHTLFRLFLRNIDCLSSLSPQTYDKFLSLLTLMGAEADFMKFGPGQSHLSHKVNKLVKNTMERSGAINSLMKYVHDKLTQTISNEKKVGYSFFSCSQEEILDSVSIRFIHRHMKCIMRTHSEKLILHKDLNEFMNNIFLIAILADRLPDRFYAITMIRQIMGVAIDKNKILDGTQVSKLLTSECIRLLSNSLKDITKKNSIIWRICNEVVLKSHSLYSYAVEKFGEEIQSSCLKNVSDIYLASSVMKDFPNLSKITAYVWGKFVRKERKTKYEIKIETPKPFYDTQYCCLVNEVCAQDILIKSKKRSHRIAMLTLDKAGKASLPSLNREEETLKSSFNQFYVHFPYETYASYALGNNEGGKLGLKDLKENLAEPQIIPELLKMQIKAGVSHLNHSILLNSNGDLLFSGKGDGRVEADSNFFKVSKNAGSKIMAGNLLTSVFYDPKANNLYAIGKNPERMLSISSTNITNAESIKLKEPSITQISVSDQHAVILYGEQHIYACPGTKRELFGLLVEGADDEFNMIRFGEEIGNIYKVLALNCGTIVLLYSRLSDKKELYSFGLPGSSGIGQGGRSGSEEYNRLEYSEAIEFKDLTGCNLMAAAITTSGELFTWGKGTHGQLGLYNPANEIIDEVNLPTRVTCLSKYNVLQVSVSNTHMLVLASERDNQSANHVFGFGDNSKNQYGKVALPTNEISFFGGKNPYFVCAGSYCSFISCGDVKEGVIHVGAECAKHNKKPIDDVVYISAIGEKAQKVQYFCKECRPEMNELVLAVRNPIKNLATKVWPNMEAIKIGRREEGKDPITKVTVCKKCKEDIKQGGYYISALKKEELSAAKLCEKCYMRTPADFSIEIYYRVPDPGLEVISDLPLLRLDQLYGTIEDYLSITLEPHYLYQFPPGYSDPKSKPTLEEFIQDFADMDWAHDTDIIELLNDTLIEKDIKIETLCLKNDLPLNFNKKPHLMKFPEEKLKKRAKILIKFNKIIKKTIEFIDFNSKSESQEDLYFGYSKIKDYVTLKTKDQIFKDVLTNSQRVKGKVEVTINRHKAFILKMTNQVDNTGQRSVFGQLWRQLRESGVEKFKKKPRPGKFPFKVKFRSEGGIDAGGLFRECIDHICEELQSSCLPLFIPTPNNKTAFGEFREKWTVNPAATLGVHFQMYEFLGSLLGMSLRCGHVLALNLSSLFWKQLINDKLEMPDLLAIDAYCVQCLEDITQIGKKITDEASFKSYLDDVFITRLSDGSEYELMKNGKKTSITLANKDLYVELVQKARLEEGDTQMKAIKTGLYRIVPQALLKLYSWKELEVKICGKPTFKVESLKKITRYNGCSEGDQFIQFFWQALEEFTDEERSLYLRFVWGRSRMPSYFDTYKQEIHVKRCARPDDALPESHTCMFQLDLPRYSSIEALKTKLRYAIRFCQSIDGDRDNFETWED